MERTGRIRYSELSRAKVSESRNIVISTCSKGGYTIAQQLIAKELDNVTSVFMKGAFHVKDIEGLYNLRDAINMAINLEENGSSNNENEWDDE